MVARIGPVISDAGHRRPSRLVYKNDRIPAADTESITVDAAGTSLLGHRSKATSPAAGSSTRPPPATPPSSWARRRHRARRRPHRRSAQLWLGNQWFTVVGILASAPARSRTRPGRSHRLPRSPAAHRHESSPTGLYVRTDPASTGAVQSVLAATVDPAAPQDVAITNPDRRPHRARRRLRRILAACSSPLGVVALVVGGSRHRQRHGHRRARTTRRDRTAPGPRRPALPHHRSVRRRISPARTDRRDRRRDPRRLRHHHLRSAAPLECGGAARGLCSPSPPRSPSAP